MYNALEVVDKCNEYIPQQVLAHSSRILGLTQKTLKKIFGVLLYGASAISTLESDLELGAQVLMVGTGYLFLRDYHESGRRNVVAEGLDFQKVPIISYRVFLVLLGLLISGQVGGFNPILALGVYNYVLTKFHDDGLKILDTSKEKILELLSRIKKPEPVPVPVTVGL